MEKFDNIIRRAADKIEDLAYLLDNDKNIEEYVFEAYSSEVIEALEDGNCKLAAFLILEAYLFGN